MYYADVCILYLQYIISIASHTRVFKVNGKCCSEVFHIYQDLCIPKTDAV